MTKELKEAIAYVRENIDMDHVRVICGDIDKQHGSLASCDIYDLSTEIRDIMEEYGADNELPEGWWESEMEVEDVFFALLDEPQCEDSTEKELIPCNIQTADLAAEFVDELFDDCEFIDKHGYMVGFICETPAVIVCRGGTNRIRFVYGNIGYALDKVNKILLECDSDNTSDDYRRIAKRNDDEITIWYEHK